jgi:hypothetical protein
VISGPIAVPVAGGNYRQWSSQTTGARIHCIRGDAGLNNFERGYVDVVNASGTVTLTWNPRMETSAGGAAPVSWPGGGTQNVWVIPESMSPFNALAELGSNVPAARATLGLATIGDLGVVAGATVQLDGSARLPAAIDIRNGINPQGSAGAVGIALAGGTSTSRILRLVSSGTFGHASQSDTGAGDPSWRLQHLLALGSDNVLYGPGRFVPFAGVAYDGRYYLGTAGQLTTTQPTPDGTHVLVEIGIGVGTNLLYFTPAILIAGTTGSQVGAYFENGIPRTL